MPLFGSLGPVPLLEEARPRRPATQRRSDSGSRLQVLGSGSGGNAIVLESRGGRILLDAGFSCRELEHRLRQVGVEPRTVRALVLTHEHQDHCRGAERFSRRHRVPVYASAGTLSSRLLRSVAERRVIRAGAGFEVGDLAFVPFAVPHDAREPVGLVVEDSAGFRLGLVSDLGSLEPSALVRLVDLDVLVIETNHDTQMLETGPYPRLLKRRVGGALGHLSNRCAALGLGSVLDAGLHTVVLYHLSRVNNLPKLALEAVGESLDRLQSAARLVLSDQFRPSGWIGLSPRGLVTDGETGV